MANISGCLLVEKKKKNSFSAFFLIHRETVNCKNKNE